MKAARERLGLSQSAAAERASLASSQIHYYETGERGPGLESLLALADAYGITLDELVGRKGASNEIADLREKLRRIRDLTEDPRKVARLAAVQASLHPKP